MHSSDSKDKKILKVLIVTLFLNLAVCLAKIIYGIMTASLSLEADGFHSLIDASSNIVGLLGVVLASRPPDEGHPYGHRKIEALASLAISFLLFVTCYEIITGVVDRIQNPVVPHVTLWSFVIMAVTIVVNFFVYQYEKKVGTELHSDILIADSSHTKSDIFVSLSVIGSFVAVLLNVPVLDMVIATGLVLFITVVAYRILATSINILIDGQLIDPQLIQETAYQVDGVRRCHRVRSRGTRSGIFVDFHIHVDPQLTTEQSHDLTHEVMNAIKEAFPQVIEVLIHTEPGYPERYDKKDPKISA